MRFRIENDFHGTAVNINVNEDDIIDRRRARDIRRKLCGVRTCSCSGQIGDRGYQPDNGGLMLAPGCSYDEIAVIAQPDTSWADPNS